MTLAYNILVVFLLLILVKHCTQILAHLSDLLLLVYLLRHVPLMVQLLLVHIFVVSVVLAVVQSLQHLAFYHLKVLVVHVFKFLYFLVARMRVGLMPRYVLIVVVALVMVHLQRNRVQHLPLLIITGIPSLVSTFDVVGLASKIPPWSHLVLFVVKLVGTITAIEYVLVIVELLAAI